MDEDEKKLEFEPKRRSRIRQLSSSSDDAELKTKSSPQKRRSIHDNNVEQIENKKLQKNKRRLSSLMDNSTNMGDHKRPKMSDTLDHTAINIDCTWNSDNSKANLNATDVDIGALFNITQSESPLKSTKKDKKARKSLIQQEVVEEIQEMELDNKEAETVETRKTPKKVTNEAVSLDAIMSLCSEHMNKVEDQKKINKSIKNKKKVRKSFNYKYLHKYNLVLILGGKAQTERC